MTTVTMPRRLMRPIASPLGRRSVLIGFGATLAAGLLLLAGASLAIGIATSGQVMPGVRVGGVELGGLSRADAGARLSEQLPSLASGQLTIAVAGADEEVVRYADLGRGYETERMVDAAFAVARGGNPLADGIARLRAVVYPTELQVIVHGYDEPALDRVAERIATEASLAATDAAVVADGATFSIERSRDGRLIQADEVRAAIAAVANTPNPADARITLQPGVVAPEITTLDARAAARDARRIASALTLTAPAGDEAEEVLALSPVDIAAWISFEETEDGVYAVVLDEAAIEARVAGLAEEIDREAANASFSVAGSGLGGVIPGVEGRTLEVRESAEALIETLRSRADARITGSFGLSVTVDQPSLTTAEAQAAFPDMQMVSSWTTNYVPGIANGFGANISIPAHDIDGTTVAPGEWFSFWGALGPINTARGYTYGGAIINGRSEPTGALAGGICSTSTTLFNAAMRFGLEIGARENHYYYIDRYPIGLDATVFQSGDLVQDMTFRNDTEHPVVVRGFGSPGRVTFQLWSVPNGRTVALSQPVTSNHRAATDTTRVDESMAPGTSKRIESPHDGFNATVSRTVRDANGNVVHQDTWFSDYRPVNGVVLTGPAGSAEAPPADQGATTGTAPAGGVVPTPSPTPSPTP